jgi:mono/diheme cytochrome c family protein
VSILPFIASVHPILALDSSLLPLEQNFLRGTSMIRFVRLPYLFSLTLLAANPLARVLLLLASFGNIDSLLADQATQPAVTPPQAAEPIDFNRQVRPILAKHCYACHGPDEAESGLNLTTFESATAECESGSKAIVPNRSSDSELLVRITSSDESNRMPPEGSRLTASQIEILKAWIEQGADFNRHWSFQPRKQVDVPEIADPSWCNNAIDRFILSKLEARGLTPAGQADKRTLIRRVYYDVLGIPPTIEEVTAFESDSNKDAYVRVVDRLLCDPRMGERWGRHWLDVVRYAETNSFERDGLKPNAWKYRDWVIRSINSDKPYDQFVTEQLAGDELDEVTIDTLTATGFYRLGIWDDEPADPLQARFDEFDDLVTVAGQGFLGLTLNCARCHDHKIDPIPQKDYYAMVAFFRDVTSYASRSDGASNNQIDVSDASVREERARLKSEVAKLDKTMREIEQSAIVKMTAEEQRATEGPGRKRVLKEKLHVFLSEEEFATYQKWRNEREKIAKSMDSLPNQEFVLGLAKCEPTPPSTFVLVRGSPQAEGDQVDPSYVAMTQGDPSKRTEVPAFVSNSKSRLHTEAPVVGRRRALAQWITDDDNWFTARTIANRLWQNHFGRGIFRSTNNLGQLGDIPTHPELLDWLANQLVEDDWSMKSIHRLILLSKAYQMSSQTSSETIAQDPANDLFSRFSMRRLSAEELRDSVLATSGDLHFQQGGKSFFPKVADEVKATQSQPGSGWGESSESDRARRSVYIHIKRSLVPPELSVFDFPDTDTTCEARFLTTQAGQALGLLNGLFVQEQATRFANRVLSMASSERDDQVRVAVELAYSRTATSDDQQFAKRLMERFESEHKLDATQQLRAYCLVLLNTNEFLYLD